MWNIYKRLNKRTYVCLIGVLSYGCRYKTKWGKMMKKNTSGKYERLLELFFRAIRGESLRVSEMALEYEVSSKSVTRTINELKAFLAEHRELVGNAELVYSYGDRCYRLEMDEFLTNRELFALVEVLIGARAFSKGELLKITGKLRKFTTRKDREKLVSLIGKEIMGYPEVKHDCESVTDRLWQIVDCICEKREISIDYYKMDRSFVTHRLRPASVMFTDYYFYLIAFKVDGNTEKPLYFRIDRIKDMTEHRERTAKGDFDFDEGILRKRSLFMWPGNLRKFRFEFSGPSLQAVLDKLPTAVVVDRYDGKYLIEAETYGDGIIMWLLSQRSWVRVTEPQEFVLQMKSEIKKMLDNYE